MDFKEITNTKYSIGKDGTVILTKTGKELTPFIVDGYTCVDLKHKGKTIRMRVHSLIVMAFFPINNNEKGKVLHLDYNILNNYYSNLQWISLESNDFYNLPKFNTDLILEVSNKTSELNRIYNGNQHVLATNNFSKKNLDTHLNSNSLLTLKDNFFYKFNLIEIIAVSDIYFIFKYNDTKLIVASYTKKMMAILLKFFK